MDDKWERSIPFYSVDAAKAAYLFRQFDSGVRLENIQPLQEGKRNSNYRAQTSAGDYVLRIFSPGDESWRMEHEIRRILQGQVPLQRLYHIGQEDCIGNRTFAIYEFVHGQSLLDAMLSGFMPEEKVLRQLGGQMAAIHEIRYPQAGFVDKELKLAEELTPLETWYGYFLNDAVRKRIGEGVADRIERLVSRSGCSLEEMDRRISLVHGDFRPTNLLLFEGKISAVLDWEFAMAGHSIADIGQLFRYENQFPASHKDAFVHAYNERSDWKLPDNWEKLGRLRDLINLLQMLGAEEELPHKFLDLSRLIERTLELWEA